jgi:indolepyruvate ferredoxin oxidoreductase alpha subunit
MKKSILPTPNRNSILCPGCPHRATFQAVKDVFGKDAVFGGDIGCYILGVYEPFEEEDFIISMGAGIGISHGISKVSDQKIAIFIGDSTFFHAGIPALINMVYNKADATIVVLDNRITAMTGHQPNAGMGLTGMDEQTEEISIAEIAKACGAEVVAVNPFNFKQTIEAVKEISSKKGVKVIISKQDCRLVFMRDARKQQRNVPIYQIDMVKCIKCNKCVEYGCPAIHVELKGKKPVRYWIDENYCWGCAVCPQICPVQAIQPLVKKENKG